MHQYRQPGLEEGAPIRETGGQTLGVGIEEDRDAPTKSSDVYEKYNVVLHAGMKARVDEEEQQRRSRRGGRRKKEEEPITPITMAFIKKYIQYSKTRCKPILTKEASDFIVNAYAKLRNDDMNANQRRTSPITARTLETLIRLATAHAKSRLSARVEENDAVVAEGVLRFALFREMAVPESRRKRRKTDQDVNMSSEEDEQGDSSDSDDDNNDGGAYRGAARPSRSTGGTATRSQRSARSNRQQANGAGNGHNNEDEDEEDDEQEESQNTASTTKKGATGAESQLSSLSLASSMPASQLPPTQASSSAQQPDEQTVSQQRLTLFRSILGSLTTDVTVPERHGQSGRCDERGESSVGGEWGRGDGRGGSQRGVEVDE